jgi:hypothetical protein
MEPGPHRIRWTTGYQSETGGADTEVPIRYERARIVGAKLKNPETPLESTPGLWRHSRCDPKV